MLRGVLRGEKAGRIRDVSERPKTGRLENDELQEAPTRAGGGTIPGPGDSTP